ncbi:MAG: F0F1 ATP synthase subunit epsilon [Psychroflexus sp.]|nr:F0F1 ATP synthase subunit epsilon [Psychroflexus sp.]MDN6309233.1 F0F1 ATP synthase subunit epsilon [Psychroflexus sp.]
MQLEIVTPEEVILDQDVQSVSVPGIEGEFQILDNHAPIVSVLTQGIIKLDANTILPKAAENAFQKQKGKLCMKISGGVIEMNNNKVIVLTD